jgi:membrane protease YdiL (CAAX protease family)
VNPRLGAWLTLVGVVAAIGYASRFSNSKPPKNAVFMYGTAVSEFVLFGIIFALVLAIASGTDLGDTFALRRPESWRRALLLSVGVLGAVWLLTVIIDPFLHAGSEQGLTPNGWQPGREGQFAANLVAFGLVGPVVEELTFRGLGFKLLERYGQGFAIVATGLAFGVWHGLVEALPLLAAFGAGLAYVRSRTRSIYPSILLHASFNTIALVVAVVHG